MEVDLGHAILGPSASGRDRRSQAVHNRLTRRWGPARDHLCIQCFEKALDWAYLHNDLDEVVSEDGSYWSEDVECYAPMCRKCHGHLDHLFGRIEYRTDITDTWGGQIGGDAFALKRRSDPEFREKCERQQRDAARLGGKALRQNPEHASRVRASLLNGALQRWACDECDYVSNAGTVQRHLNRTGHLGRREINV